MRRFFPTVNLTALLALAALADLIFYRVLNGVFLPSQHGGTAAERILWQFGLFSSNLAGILALLLATVALLHALRSNDIFPRSMRITVSTVGLFFCVLSGLGVLWILATPRYHIHLRISHGFLVFFLALGIWHGQRPRRFKVGVTLFALPIILETAALFFDRMGWGRINAGQMVRLAHAIALAAMTVAPVLLTPRPWNGAQSALGLSAGAVLAASLGTAAMLRFDLMQAVAFYGLRIDLSGLALTSERVYTGLLIVAFACLGAATASCLSVRGPSRLTGWGLLLLAVAGFDMTSPKAALFTLCGLLALAIASVQTTPITAISPQTPGT